MADSHGMILRLLRDSGPLSRAELSRRSGLSATTLTHVTARLLADGLIGASDDTDAHALGRPARPLALVPGAAHVCGVHIGSGQLQAVIVDLAGQRIAATSVDVTGVGTSPATVLDRVAAMVSMLMVQAALPAKALAGVGVGVPGPVDGARRQVLTSFNLGWSHVPVAAELEKRLGLAVVIEHNVSAMALAESRYGLGRTAAALLFVYLRTGLGAGLVVDGNIFRPGGRGGVELGHIKVVENGAPCVCGNQGCLETLLSEAALRRLLPPDEAREANVFAALTRHPAVLAASVAHLSTALGNVVNLLGPDMIALGGLLADAPRPVLDAIREHVKGQLMPHMRDVLRVEPTSFGASVGAIGGAALALDHFVYSGAMQ